jgi:hypothetical protein
LPTPVQEALEGHAVVQILAGMQLVAHVDAGIVERIEDRRQRFAQLAERFLDQPGRALRPRIQIGPGQRAGKARVRMFKPRRREAFAASFICPTAHAWRAGLAAHVRRGEAVEQLS